MRVIKTTGSEMAVVLQCSGLSLSHNASSSSLSWEQLRTSKPVNYKSCCNLSKFRSSGGRKGHGVPVRYVPMAGRDRSKLHDTMLFGRTKVILVADDQDSRRVSETLIHLLRRSVQSRATTPPQKSLQEGRWVKLICGASFEDVVDIRNLSLVYTLAGVDCIDCAADAAVVAAVLEGVTAAQSLARQLDPSTAFTLPKPWIMVSINDDDDPHFRKAEFDPELCPPDCPRPCVRVCPAAAIAFNNTMAEGETRSNSVADTHHTSGHAPVQQMDGVILERCYGCGRCLPVCPLGLIHARTYVRELEAVAGLLHSSDVDAVEIHTGAGHLESFHKLVTDLSDALQGLQLIAVSVPDLGKSMVPVLESMYRSLQPSIKGLNLWQLDGRPMSGDIGMGATKAAISLGSHVAASSDCPPGFLQLAGGTNAHTVHALKREGLFLSAVPEKDATIAGVAYGGYARKIVTKYLEKMGSCKERWSPTSSNGALPHGMASQLGIEHYPTILLGALQEAFGLVGPVKGF